MQSSGVGFVTGLSLIVTIFFYFSRKCCVDNVSFRFNLKFRLCSVCQTIIPMLNFVYWDASFELLLDVSHFPNVFCHIVLSLSIMTIGGIEMLCR